MILAIAVVCVMATSGVVVGNGIDIAFAHFGLRRHPPDRERGRRISPVGCSCPGRRPPTSNLQSDPVTSTVRCLQWGHSLGPPVQRARRWLRLGQRNLRHSDRMTLEHSPPPIAAGTIL